MYKKLNSAVEAAVLFDNRPEKEEFSCLLLGKQSRLRKDYETADSRSLKKILRDKWLSDEVFVSYRHKTEFKEILNKLS